MTDTLHPPALPAQTDPIPASRVLPALVEAGFAPSPAASGMLYRAIASGAIPAERTVTNRLSVRRSNLPVVAAVLGLTPASPVSAAA